MDILSCLAAFPFIEEFRIVNFRPFRGGFYLKVEANLKDGSMLFIREYLDERERSYSYHWQNRDGSIRGRWDNAPHHRGVSTYPHHKHFAGSILPSHSTSCKEILSEIAKLIEKQKQR